MSDTEGIVEVVPTVEELEELKQRIRVLEMTVTCKEEQAAAAVADTQAVEKEMERLIEKDKQSKVSAEAGIGIGVGRMVYMSSSRKLDRFYDKPRKVGDLSVEDWIQDAQSVITSRKLEANEEAAFVIEHLAGKARREILGRGADIKSKPDKIFAVLARVFGNGDSLPQLQQRFFAYKQSDEEDFITCSLELVNLYDRIVQLDSSFKPGRESQLKSRLAEAVNDENVRMELRRLNADQPALCFFDARDHVIKLMGQRDKPLKPKREATVREVTAESDQSKNDDQIAALAKQVSILQKQIESLTTVVQTRSTSKRQSTPSDDKPKCWTCNLPGHFRNECPKKRQRSEREHLN